MPLKAYVLLIVAGFLAFAPGPLDAQSTLTFARVMELADLPLTGYAVVNPRPTPAAVVFTLYDVHGSVVSASNQTVVGGGQLALLASELFPGVARGGWVEATSPVSGLRGFWLGGDFSTFEDGTGTSTAVSEFVLPLVTTQAELDIVNTGLSGAAILIHLYGPDGQEVADPVVQLVAARGSSRVQASSIFPLADLALATHAMVTCSQPCVGTSLLRDYLVGPSLAVTNGVSTSSNATDLNFPHVVQGVFGSLNYASVVSITNLTSSFQSLTFSFTTEAGVVLAFAQRDLVGHGTVREDVQSLFGLTGVQNGSIKVTSELPCTGIVVYAETTHRGVAVTNGLSVTSTNLLLSHIADLPPWLTGLALLNPGKTAATVTVYAITPAGALIGKTSLTIGPGGKTAKLLSELIPQTQLRSLDGGFVYISSTAPLYGMELFFTRDLQILSNVPAFGLAAGEVFIPPGQ